jgi:hypothetical protein
MKKYIGLTLLAFILIYVTYLFRLGYERIIHKEQTANEIRKLPELKLDYIKYTSLNITPKYKILYLFSPDCDHCQYMTQSILQNPSAFCNCEIRMITFGTRESTMQFIDKFGINKIPFISISIDSSFQFPKIFGTSIIPSIFIYKDNSLITKYLGEVKIESILEKLK